MRDPDTLVIEFLGISIWHHDPCKDGTDDSCGWFKRARHGNKDVLKNIISQYDFEWDRVFESDNNKVYFSGWFRPEGQPVLSPMGIVLNMFWLAAYEHFNRNRDKANNFCQRNIFDILHFAENNTDSIFESITCKYGIDKRADRISSMAACVYGFILRKDRKFYDHPRFHFWHYRLAFPIYYRIKNLFNKDRAKSAIDSNPSNRKS